MVSLDHLIVLVLPVLGVGACGGSETSGAPPESDAANGTPDGAIGPNSPGVSLAREYDRLVEQSYHARCKVCACGGLSPSSPQAEACTGAIIDRYPESRQQMLCKIGVEKTYGNCAAGAANCGAADVCNATRTTDVANCPPFDSTAAMAMPPPACQGLF
jgi:hypothetical protein